MNSLTTLVLWLDDVGRCRTSKLLGEEVTSEPSSVSFVVAAADDVTGSSNDVSATPLQPDNVANVIQTTISQ